MNVLAALQLLLVSIPASSWAWWYSVGPAKIPNDLTRIRACRATFQPLQTPLQRSHDRFLNADAVQAGTAVCFVAKEHWPPTFRVLGCVDVIGINSNSNNILSIKNVYVRPEARGQGIAKQLLLEIIKTTTTTTTTTRALDTTRNNENDVCKIILDVETSNAPAFELYRTMGFNCPGLHGVMAQVSRWTGANFVVQMEKKL
jgi:ribosomal protein S18 acetylase RimI-like enzyme